MSDKEISSSREPFAEKLLSLLGLGATVLIALAIAVLSILPPSAVHAPLSLFPHADKIAHGVSYGALALAAACGVLPSPRQDERFFRLGMVVLASAFYGGTLEIIQSLVGRSFSWLDMAANALGALLGVLVWNTFLVVHERRKMAREMENEA